MSNDGTQLRFGDILVPPNIKCFEHRKKIWKYCCFRFETLIVWMMVVFGFAGVAMFNDKHVRWGGDGSECLICRLISILRCRYGWSIPPMANAARNKFFFSLTRLVVEYPLKKKTNKIIRFVSHTPPLKTMQTNNQSEVQYQWLSVTSCWKWIVFIFEFLWRLIRLKWIPPSVFFAFSQGHSLIGQYSVTPRHTESEHRFWVWAADKYP